MKNITSIDVKYKHVDGWHVFTSDEIEGLYVASQDASLAYHDVATSIEVLLKLNEEIECSATPEQSFHEFVKCHRKENSAKTDIDTEIPLRLSSQRYAVACG